MTLTGPNMHRVLMDGYKDAQSRLESLRFGLGSIEQRRSDLDDQRSEALVDLAKHYLPELTHEAIDNSWEEVRGKVSRILLRKEEHFGRVERGLNTLKQERQDCEDQLIELNDSLERTLTRQEEIATQVETELQNDASFIELSRQAATAEAALERAESNLEEIEQDASKKLPAYDESALFSYLRKRHFGTAKYTKRGFTRRMDRWVASLIDYRKAKRSYEFLSDTPDQMKALIVEDRSALDTVMTELEKRRDRVAERLGLRDVAEEADRVTQRRENVLVELERIRERYDVVQRELTELEDTRGKYYLEAVEVFREMLSQFDAAELERWAHQTDSLSDDQVVARLFGVEDKYENLNDLTSRHHEELLQMQDCIDALGRMIQKFRASQFDSFRSSFLPSVDISLELRRAKKAEDIDEVWDTLRRLQRWGPKESSRRNPSPTEAISSVLIGAMSEAAGSSMRDHARRAGKRRRRKQRQKKEPWFGDSSGSWEWFDLD